MALTFHSSRWRASTFLKETAHCFFTSFFKSLTASSHTTVTGKTLSSPSMRQISRRVVGGRTHGGRTVCTDSSIVRSTHSRIWRSSPAFERAVSQVCTRRRGLAIGPPRLRNTFKLVEPPGLLPPFIGSPLISPDLISVLKGSTVQFSHIQVTGDLAEICPSAEDPTLSTITR
jgi:hypothetical protein